MFKYLRSIFTFLRHGIHDKRPISLVAYEEKTDVVLSDKTPPTERFLFLDIETTGLNRERVDEIVEIAILDEDGVALMNTLVRPTFTKEWHVAEQVHGLSPSDVATAPTLAELLPQIERICAEKTVVCYNADFDTSFFPFNFFTSVECAMRRFSEVNPNGNSWISLDQAAKQTGYLPQGKTHRALEDAMACRHVWIQGIPFAERVKAAQVMPSMQYRSHDGQTINAIFNEIFPQELTQIESGNQCKLWSAEDIDAIYLYRAGTSGGQGKAAKLLKSDNPNLAGLFWADTEVFLLIKYKKDNIIVCEISVKCTAKRDDFIPDHPVYFDDIDSDIYRCFIVYKNEFNDLIKTFEKLILAEQEIAKICESKGGRYYKSKAKGANFAVIFSTRYHTIDTVYRLQQSGYKVTTFDRALKYFSIAHMWNISAYLEEKEMRKKYDDYMMD